VTLESTNVTLPTCEIVKDDANANRGSYSVRASGNPTSPGNAIYSYKIAEVKIPVVADLQISFWKKTINDPGKYASVDLMFKSGKKLSKLINYKNNLGMSMDPCSGIGTVGAGWENITCQIGVGELVGDEISGIIITFDKPASAGLYLAYFDDIFISTRKDIPNAIDEVQNEEKIQYIFSRNQTLVFNAAALNSIVKIYDISGRLLSDFVLVSTEVPINLRNGIYIVMVITKQGVCSKKIIL
jgi:hypothetical protein